MNNNQNNVKMPKNIFQMLTKGGIVGILAYIIFYFGGTFVERITAIQKDILQIRIQLTKIQSTLLSKEDIQEMIETRMQIHQARYCK